MTGPAGVDESFFAVSIAELLLLLLLGDAVADVVDVVVAAALGGIRSLPLVVGDDDAVEATGTRRDVLPSCKLFFAGVVLDTFVATATRPPCGSLGMDVVDW